MKFWTQTVDTPANREANNRHVNNDMKLMRGIKADDFNLNTTGESWTASANNEDIIQQMKDELEIRQHVADAVNSDNGQNTIRAGAAAATNQ